MYAQCPLCEAIFRVTAAQLGAAKGQVRCGGCHQVFDALEHLRDDDYVDRAVEDRVRGCAPLDTGNPPTPPAPHENAQRPTPGSSSDDPAPPETHAAPLSTEVSFEPPVRPAGAPRGATARTDHGPVPDAIREDMERIVRTREGRRKATIFGCAAGVLLLVLGLQAVWFNPLDASRSYPQWHEAIDRFCTATGCVLPQRREPDLVRVLRRDVRVHPRYEGALQITATLVNDAPFRQPYPHMSFTLFNVNGQIIAIRVFSPREYLGADIDTSPLFEPGVPMEVALQVLAPEDVAVSFEFRFL